MECDNISEELFRILADPEAHGGACWNCASCLASAVKVAKMVKAFEDRMTGVEKVATSNTAAIKKVDLEVSQLRKELEEEKAKNKEAENKRDNKYVTREEYRERETRRCNLIVHRLKEAQTQVGSERREHDLRECENILQALNMEEGREVIKACRRIGEAGEAPRPLVLVLRTEMVKDRILDVARNLRDTAYHEVGIVPDLTVQQRKEEQQMGEEADRRNEEDLTEEDVAKNLKWLLVGPRGEKRLIKGVPREQPQSWRGTGRVNRGVLRGGGRGRGGTATGANRAAMGTRTLGGQPLQPTRARLESTKRTRDQDSQEMEEEGEGQESGSPQRKK